MKLERERLAKELASVCEAHGRELAGSQAENAALQEKLASSCSEREKLQSDLQAAVAQERAAQLELKERLSQLEILQVSHLADMSANRHA